MPKIQKYVLFQSFIKSAKYTYKTESSSKVFHSFTILSEYIDNATINKNRLLRTDLLQYETPCIRTLKWFGTIHILRHHIFGIFGPPPPYVSMFLSAMSLRRTSKDRKFYFLLHLPKILTKTSIPY